MHEGLNFLLARPLTVTPILNILALNPKTPFALRVPGFEQFSVRVPAVRHWEALFDSF